MNRREFAKIAAAGVASASLLPNMSFARRAPLPIRKAVNLSMVTEDLSVADKFRLLKDVGFAGVEIDRPSEVDRNEILKARDATGLVIHGVVDSVHWDKTLGDADPAVRAEGLTGLKAALQDAHDFGATTVLLVPAVVNKDISYADAYRRSQEEIRKAIPTAEQLGVRIAIEEVWNHFLLSPLEFAKYVDEFQSPWVGAYFDIGNIVNYGWPEQWITTLGPRILKLHVKEYSREARDKAGPWAGFKVEIGEGDNDWPAVRRALTTVGYEGWATAEVQGGDRNRLAQISGLMDQYVIGA